jgi:hypothetical protein
LTDGGLDDCNSSQCCADCDIDNYFSGKGNFTSPEGKESQRGGRDFFGRNGGSTETSADSTPNWSNSSFCDAILTDKLEVAGVGLCRGNEARATVRLITTIARLILDDSAIRIADIKLGSRYRQSKNENTYNNDSLFHVNLNLHIVGWITYYSPR